MTILGLTLRLATLDEILPLRHDVIIAGTDRTSDEFDGDRDPATRHYGAFTPQSDLIVCLTMMRREFDPSMGIMINVGGTVSAAADGGLYPVITLPHEIWAGRPAWQLRGMATRPDWQGRGAGRRLLDFAERDTARASGLTSFWCNARPAAARFYERQGWRLASAEFTVPGVGPHVKMWKDLRQV